MGDEHRNATTRYRYTQGRSQGGHEGLAPQSILDKNKDVGNYDKYLPLRDCFLAGLLISGLTKEKFNTTLNIIQCWSVCEMYWL